MRNGQVMSAGDLTHLLILEAYRRKQGSRCRSDAAHAAF